MDNEEWQRWRGATEQRISNHDMKIEDHCERLAEVEKGLNAVLVKLAVPLFAVSIAGTVLGALVVAWVSKH
jgi:hypothetical protein